MRGYQTAEGRLGGASRSRQSIPPERAQASDKGLPLSRGTAKGDGQGSGGEGRDSEPAPPGHHIRGWSVENASCVSCRQRKPVLTMTTVHFCSNPCAEFWLGDMLSGWKRKFDPGSGMAQALGGVLRELGNNQLPRSGPGDGADLRS